MKKTLVFIFISLILCGCQRGCQRFKRNTQSSARNYEVVLFSGGKAVFVDSFHGIITTEEGNGFYYFKGDTLIEISGDYILRSIK